MYMDGLYIPPIFPLGPLLTLFASRKGKYTGSFVPPQHRINFRWMTSRVLDSSISSLERSFPWNAGELAVPVGIPTQLILGCIVHRVTRRRSLKCPAARRLGPTRMLVGRGDCPIAVEPLVIPSRQPAGPSRPPANPSRLPINPSRPSASRSKPQDNSLPVQRVHVIVGVRSPTAFPITD